MPLISDRWTSHFSWLGEGEMPEQERARLHQIVQTAHAKGQRVRFWATPDSGVEREGIWAELVSAGVEVGRNDPCPCGSGKKHKKCCASA